MVISSRRNWRRATLVLAIVGLGIWYRKLPAVDTASNSDELKNAVDMGQLLDKSYARGSEAIAFAAPNHISRRLLQNDLANCTPPAIEQFPKTLMSAKQRKEGGVMMHILVAAYMFLALAIACDEYFVPACEKVCEVLKLESDVAGATFMAAGSSAPELATAVIGVFIAKDDIGLGAVVGSAVFNIMFVIGICAIFAGMVVYLHWWPLFRDTICYTISIIALVLIIYDEKVKWYESMVLLILYVLYIVVMIFNSKLERWIVPKFSCCKPRKADGDPNATLVNGETPMTYVSSDLQEVPGHSYTRLVAIHEDSNNVASDSDSINSMQLAHSSTVTHTHAEESETSVFTVPDGCCKRFLYVVGMPITLVMFVTVPDCRKERWRHWWFVTFLMSCVWIGAFSYVMVWMITVVGHTFGIPDTVMGLTFIAAGASVPDAIASLLVVKDGLGDMAVSNAVGSNVFDILLCLGLPYFLKSVINSGEPVEVYSAGLTYSSLTLLTTVLFLLLSIHCNGWKLDKKYGVILLIVYVIFNIIASLYELNLFGFFHPPECPSNY